MTQKTQPSAIFRAHHLSGVDGERSSHHPLASEVTRIDSLSFEAFRQNTNGNVYGAVRVGNTQVGCQPLFVPSAVVLNSTQGSRTIFFKILQATMFELYL
jgi:hypothetical protein